MPTGRPVAVFPAGATVAGSPVRTATLMYTSSAGRYGMGPSGVLSVRLAWGLLCTALIFAFAPQIMRVMGAEPDVVPLGVEYLRAGCLGFPMLMALYAISGSLRGMGNTWMPMVILLIVNAVNAVVTYVLISGVVADLGVRASGIGYASAGSFGGVLALALAASGYAPVRMNVARMARVSRESFGRLFHIGLPVGLFSA